MLKSSVQAYLRTLIAVILAFFMNGLILAAVPANIGLAQAISLYNQGDFDASLVLLREVVKKDPPDRTARVNLIQLLREAGLMDEAILHLQDLLAEEPNDPQLQSALVSALFLSGRSDGILALSPSPPSPEAEYWKGLAFAAEGDDDKARQILEQLTQTTGFYPLAYAALGEIALRQGDYGAAEAFLQKALVQEPNLTSLFFPLAKVSAALKKPQNAYRYLQRAKGIAPWDPAISLALEELIAAHPEVAPSSPIIRQAPSQEFLVPTVSHWPQNPDEIPEVSIGLVEKTRQVWIKTGDRFRLMKNKRRKLSGDGQTVLRIQWTPDGLEVYDANNQLRVRSDKPLRLIYKNPGATTALFDVEYGQGSFWSGSEHRAYRGAFLFLPKKNGMTVVNCLNVEEYLYAVVPSEVSPKWPRAVLEAQAIAARTYAYANMGKSPERGFDLYGSVASQAYNGIASENAATNEAVDATKHLILTYNHRPISAFYSANSGGFSETSRNVWGMDLPYLKSIPDPQLTLTAPFSPASLRSWLSQRPTTYSSHPNYSARSAYRWSLWLSREFIEKSLSDAKIGRIVSVVTLGRSESGRVKYLRFRGEDGELVLPGTVVRSKLGLRSTLFMIEPKLGPDGLPEAFYLTGAGWGHGVGMCQSGAAGMAAAGFSASSILSHYYPGASLTSVNVNP